MGTTFFASLRMLKGVKKERRCDNFPSNHKIRERERQRDIGVCEIKNWKLKWARESRERVEREKERERERVGECVCERESE